MGEVLSREKVTTVRRGGGTVRQAATPDGATLDVLVDEPDRHETATITRTASGGLLTAQIGKVQRGIGPAPDGADRVETRYR